MSADKTCPHCGHKNLKQAMYCFQCGNALSDDHKAGHVSRRSQRILKTMLQTDTGALRSSLSTTGLLSSLDVEEPLTCLACGALNRPNARFCTACGTALVVPDEEAHLLAFASARTHVGQVRKNNEDSIGLWAQQGVLLALVADGMGGAAGGEEASRLTVESVQAHFVGDEKSVVQLLTDAEEVISDKLAAVIQDANLAVMDRSGQNADLRGMGTTATLVYIRGRRAIFAHVGDSRAYLVDAEQGWITQITSDHSYVEALVVAGHITTEEAARHPMRNVLYRALGQMEDTVADVYDRYLKHGDRIVLCSDGLTRHLTSEEIAEQVLLDENPDAATQRLVELANKRGGGDNISAIVILIHAASDVTAKLSPEIGNLIENKPDVFADRPDGGRHAVRYSQDEMAGDSELDQVPEGE